jgi:hypothetical protein
MTKRQQANTSTRQRRRRQLEVERQRQVHTFALYIETLGEVMNEGKEESVV